MAKNGQAKALSNDEFAAVLDEIEHHRYPAKNALIIQISFKLGLRAQEMALLRIREIAALSDEFPRGYKIKDVLVLPKSFTKGARAMAAIGNKTNERTSVRFTVAEFDRLVAQIAKDAKRRKSLTAADYYPPIKKSGGLTRELPLADSARVTEGTTERKIWPPLKAYYGHFHTRDSWARLPGFSAHWGARGIRRRGSATRGLLQEGA